MGADADGVSGLIATLGEHHTRIAHAEGDFLGPAVPDRLIDKAIATFGHIDILVVNHPYNIMGGLEDDDG